jgi:D-threo-aldose 1-dehydrogenase
MCFCLDFSQTTKILLRRLGGVQALKTVVIPGTNLRSSKFMFGTASLFNAGNADKRYRLLKAAIDAGFTHFDTAPYYGFGAAERDLKAVLREHPDVSVTTKVGIYSPGGQNQSDAMIFFRKAAGRLMRRISAPTKSFELSKAKEALDESLRRLGRETIDVYALHEPDPGQVDMHEWLAWLQSAVEAGKVRYFGLAITHHRLEHIARECPQLCQYIQLFDSLERKEANALEKFGLPRQVTYGYVSAARKNGSQASVNSILREALKRNPNGSIIVSTTKPERTTQYSRLLEEVVG